MNNLPDWLREKLASPPTAGAGIRTPEANAWRNIRQRCLNPKHPKYRHYGGRGIKCCSRWAKLHNFLADMGPRPSLVHTIERKDSNGDYEPSNCRWATRTEQQNNKRNNSTLTLRGRTQTVTDWARELGISQWTIRSRIKLGWSHELTLTHPVNPRYWRARRQHAA